MNTITHGHISVEDGTKAKEEYAPARKVRVELHFAVPEGTDATAYIDGVAAQADAKVKELLGQKISPKAAVQGQPPAQPETPKPIAKTKEDLAREAGVSETQVKATGPKRPTKPAEAPKPDPAAIVDDTSATEAVEEDFSIPGTEDAKPISDDEVNAYVGKVNKLLNDPPKIREIIGSFKPEGWTNQFTLRDIPQESRQAFKDKLKALLPAEQQKGL